LTLLLSFSTVLSLPSPQSLLDPSFDKFFSGSESFNQAFNSIQSQPRPAAQQRFVSPRVSPQPAQNAEPPQTNFNNGDNDDETKIYPQDHATALERHSLQKQQLAEVVEEHNKVVNFRAKLIQSEKESQNQEPTTEAQDSTNIDINEKLVKVGKDSSTSKLSAFLNIDERKNDSDRDNKQDLRTENEEEETPLSDLREDVIKNLELITELVEQVRKLDILAKSVDKSKSWQHKDEFYDEEYYFYDNDIEDIEDEYNKDEQNRENTVSRRPTNNRSKNIGLKIRPDQD